MRLNECSRYNHASEAKHITNDTALSELSLSARLAVALHCFERFCQQQQIDHPTVTEFLNYLWEYHTVGTPEEWSQWDSRTADLVDTGLGYEFPEAFEPMLQAKGIEPVEFRRLIEGVVEIIYGSFFSVAHDKESLSYLQQVFAIVGKYSIEPPSIETFLNSRFSDRNGWGKVLSPSERDTWRYL